MSSDNFPESLDNVIGNKSAIQEIKDAVNSALMRGDSAPHILLTGPAGTGKTSLSKLVSKEMGTRFVYIMGPSVSKKQNIALILLGLDDNDVIMIDEIHALDKNSAETFYNAMLNFELTVIGENNEVTAIPLKKFTLIGATTNPGLLKAALRQRFRQIRIELYSAEELAQILKNYAQSLDICIEDESLMEISLRSRGTPRLAKYFLEKARDMVLSRFQRDNISMKDILQMFEESGISNDGCTQEDMKYMDILENKFNGRPAGLNSIASIMGVDKEHIQSEIEPWLVSLGYIERHSRGRVLIKNG